MTAIVSGISDFNVLLPKIAGNQEMIEHLETTATELDTVIRRFNDQIMD